MIIGLMGAIASGKTEVAKCWEQHGFRILEADKVGHTVYEPGSEAYQELISIFGDVILNADETINRSKLGEKVFSDSQKLDQLNSIIHPALIRFLKDEIALARELQNDNLIIDAALLADFGLVPLVDHVVMVLAPLEKRLYWLQNNRDLSFTDALNRITAQTDPIIWAQYAHHIILNLGAKAELIVKTKKLIEFITNKQGTSHSVTIW